MLCGWVNPKDGKSRRRGGKSIYIPGLDRRLMVADARKLFDEAPTARQIFGCSNRTCCGDIERMLKNPEAHLVVQKGRQVEDLSATPESLRTDRFLTEHVEQSRRRAEWAMRLKKADDEVKTKIAKASKRLDRVEDVLVSLHERTGPVEFAKEASVRIGGRGTGPADLEGTASIRYLEAAEIAPEDSRGLALGAQPRSP